MSPLDFQRLAVRVEHLHRQSTQGWHPADELSMRNLLSGRDPRHTLPSVKQLRDWAEGFSDLDDGTKKRIQADWSLWLTWTLRAEGWVRNNDPRNPKRMMRDMARGKFPGFR